jgi:hypothetical protein
LLSPTPRSSSAENYLLLARTLRAFLAAIAMPHQDAAIAAVFKEASDRFQATLSDEDRVRFTKYASAEEMLEDIQQWPVISKQRRRGTRFLKQIKALSDQLSPYFDAIGIIVQTDSAHIGVVWGAFRIVLQVLYSTNLLQ